MIGILMGLVVAYSVLQNPYSDGSQMIYVGETLNFIALATNGWQMPVFSEGLTEKRLHELDPLDRHKLGNDQTNFKFLCDWANIGIGVASPGDLLMFYGTFMNIFHEYFRVTSNGIVLKVQYRF